MFRKSNFEPVSGVTAYRVDAISNTVSLVVVDVQYQFAVLFSGAFQPIIRWIVDGQQHRKVQRRHDHDCPVTAIVTVNRTRDVRQQHSDQQERVMQAGQRACSKRIFRD